jgi:hypothetical protein
MSSIFDIFDNSAQQQAAQAQTQGIQQGISSLNSYYGQGAGALNQNYSAGLQPFMQNTSQANQGTTQLGNVLGLNGANGSQQAQQTLQNTPGYQFQKQQGNNAINAAAAANGTLNSGNQLTALSNYNQGLAGTTYNNYVSQLQPYLGYSTSSAQGQGNLYSGLGDQLSSLYQGQGNAAYGADTSIGNANANAALGNLSASRNLMNAGMNLGSSLLGFLSDERAKDDIAPVGELYDGQTVFRYRYKGDERHQIGLIAQEVEDEHPEAVFDIGELKGVDYRAATNLAARLAPFANDDRRAPENSNYAAALLKMAA